MKKINLEKLFKKHKKEIRKDINKLIVFGSTDVPDSWVEKPMKVVPVKKKKTK